ncbi:MAG TPA: glycosyltransferase, partial [Verrucomicrobiae bacterium]|nr:glycosyltransferase [Verrucomicrobiae bacterium]
MKFLLLNQAFYPDVVSSAQHLSDLASGLVERGHQVTVVASRRSYDNPRLVYPEHETWRAIEILRLSCTGCGKRSRWSRWIDFGTFWICCAARLARLRRHDVVVALTSPPLISVLGASYAAVMGSRFYYWVMDLNPDEAIAAGWLERGSLVSKCLEGMSRLSLR